MRRGPRAQVSSAPLFHVGAVFMYSLPKPTRVAYVKKASKEHQKSIKKRKAPAGCGGYSSSIGDHDLPSRWPAHPSHFIFSSSSLFVIFSSSLSACAERTAGATSSMSGAAAGGGDEDRLFAHTEYEIVLHATEAGGWRAQPAGGAQAPGGHGATVRVGRLPAGVRAFPLHVRCIGVMARATDSDGALQPGEGHLLLLCEGVGPDSGDTFPRGLTHQTSGLWPELGSSVFAGVTATTSKHVVNVLCRSRCMFAAQRSKAQPKTAAQGAQAMAGKPEEFKRSLITRSGGRVKSKGLYTHIRSSSSSGELSAEQVCREVENVIRVTRLLLQDTEEAAAGALAAAGGRQGLVHDREFREQLCGLLLAAVTEHPLATPARMDALVQQALLPAGAPAAPPSQETRQRAAGRPQTGVLVPCGDGQTCVPVQLGALLRNISQGARRSLDACHADSDVGPQGGEHGCADSADDDAEEGRRDAFADDDDDLASDGTAQTCIAYPAEIFLGALLAQGSASSTDDESPESSLLAGLVSQHEQQLRGDEDAVQVGSASARAVLSRAGADALTRVGGCAVSQMSVLEWLSHWSTRPTGAMRGLRPVTWEALYEHAIAFMAVGVASGGIEYGEATPVSLCVRVCGSQRGTAGPASLQSARARPSPRRNFSNLYHAGPSGILGGLCGLHAQRHGAQRHLGSGGAGSVAV